VDGSHPDRSWFTLVDNTAFTLITSVNFGIALQNNQRQDKTRPDGDIKIRPKIDQEQVTTNKRPIRPTTYTQSNNDDRLVGRGKGRAMPRTNTLHNLRRAKPSQHTFRKAENKAYLIKTRSRLTVLRISLTRRAHPLDCWLLGRRPKFPCCYLVDARRGGAKVVPDVLSRASNAAR